MKNKVVISGLLTCAILAAIGYSRSSVTAQTATPAPAATPTTVPAPSMGLKDAYKGKFLMGTAGDVPRGYSDVEQANIKANYNIITPENCMKPQPIHGSEETYNFTTPDAIVQWCQEN